MKSFHMIEKWNPLSNKWMSLSVVRYETKEDAQSDIDRIKDRYTKLRVIKMMISFIYEEQPHL